MDIRARMGRRFELFIFGIYIAYEERIARRISSREAVVIIFVVDLGLIIVIVGSAAPTAGPNFTGIQDVIVGIDGRKVVSVGFDCRSRIGN